MKVFNTDMELVTFIFIIFEAVMLLYQLLFFLQRPFEKKRKYYIILLILYLIYNVFGGLYPDPNNTSVPLMVQNALAWGSGVVLACFLPYYFYKAFNLERLKFHARYGVLFFLLAPFSLFFGLDYLINHNIDRAIKHGVIIPCVYAVICVTAMYRAIKEKADQNETDGKEMYLSLISIAPWVSMPILSYFRVSQIPEVLVMNGGFLVITGVFVLQAIKETRENNIRLQTLLTKESDGEVKEDLFLQNCQAYNLSPREIEVAALIAVGLKYRVIAERLFIQERTVTTHVQKMFLKTGAKNKVELVNLLKGKP